jgi:hypothetical protein
MGPNGGYSARDYRCKREDGQGLCRKAPEGARVVINSKFKSFKVLEEKVAELYPDPEVVIAAFGDLLFHTEF